jgi:hypothetical protein
LRAVDHNQRRRRLAELTAIAEEAEQRGDGWAAGDAWRAYELVRDAGRDPDELLAEGVALSALAIELASESESRRS